uniref:AIG1-type G domain-containing protein n=2 Tax=Poecilia formosa TaxID=48698 RepID=A0A096M8J6_POEFO
IISNSDVISPGTPVVYQLKTRKETVETLTRVTFGKKKQSKPNKTILLVGETGAGKSTLINALVNYAMGVTFEDKAWFQIIEDEKRSQTESQTSDVIVYQIFGFEGKTLPFSLTIIDTPGYGDTRGIEHDIIVSERLFQLFQSKNGIHELHAVGLVVKSSVNRLSDRLKYIFDSVMSQFGKDIEEKIVALVTHSNGRKPKDLLGALNAAKIKCAKDEKEQPVYFLFNNCQHEERTEGTEEKKEPLKIADNVTMRGLSGFTAFLGKTAPRKLDMTLDVLNERIRLSACIQNLQERIRLSELKEAEITQIKEALKNHEEKKEKNEKFAVEVHEAYKEKEAIGGELWLMTLIKGAVCCTVCEENCHYSGCTKLPKDCEVMKDGRCTVCSSKCPVSVHVKGKWRYVTRTRKVQRNMEDIRKRSKIQRRLSFLESLKGEITNLKAEKSNLLEECFQHVVNLEQIALKVNSVSTFVHLDFLIDKMKENGETKKAQKLEEIKKKGDEGNGSMLQYVWGKFEALKRKV